MLIFLDIPTTLKPRWQPCNLSGIFKKLATSADLLDTDIHEIEAFWTGLEELKQANYTLQSLPKGLKFLRVVPISESSKVMGLVGIHDPDALQHFAGLHLLPLVWERRPK